MLTECEQQVSSNSVPGIEPLSRVKVNALDLGLLTLFLYQAANDPKIGWGDAERSLDQLTRELSQRFQPVPLKSLESALWFANMLDEEGKFWSPRGESFEEFQRRLLYYYRHRVEFDRSYNKLLLKDGLKKGEGSRD